MAKGGFKNAKAPTSLKPHRPPDHGRVQRAVAESAMRRALDAFHCHRVDLAIALDQPLGRAALELDMDKLGGDLGRSVEAQRVGTDEIGLAFHQFLFVETI